MVGRLGGRARGLWKASAAGLRLRSGKEGRAVRASSEGPLGIIRQHLVSEAIRRLASRRAARALSEARARHPRLGFSGDEIVTRPRSKNFGTPDEWLSGVATPIGGREENRFAGTNTKADVVFAFFGYNESYAGAEGLDAFRKQLSDWITHTLAQRYNGRTAPRLVLFPIAHERSGNLIYQMEGRQPAAGALPRGRGDFA